MNNALTISCVDSMAILFMFYLKLFLGCCNDKTSSALTQKASSVFAPDSWGRISGRADRSGHSFPCVEGKGHRGV